MTDWTPISGGLSANACRKLEFETLNANPNRMFRKATLSFELTQRDHVIQESTNKREAQTISARAEFGTGHRQVLLRYTDACVGHRGFQATCLGSLSDFNTVSARFLERGAPGITAFSLIVLRILRALVITSS